MLQWADELHQFSSTGNWLSRAQQLLTTSRTATRLTIPVPGVNPLLLGPASAAIACFQSFDSKPPAMLQLLVAMQALVTPGSLLASELSAGGYDAQAVFSSTDAAWDALEAANNVIVDSLTDSGSTGDDSSDGSGPTESQQQQQQQHCEEAVQQLTASLQQLGQVLTAFAVPLYCNNPICRSATGPTEQSLVGGRSCICAGCRIARYCGRDCQRVHWKRHKPVCKALVARSAPAAAAGAETGHVVGG
jgi:hypothetical protein